MAFTPPPYPYDRLTPIIEAASAHRGGAVDCSIGTPCDDPPELVSAALRESTGARGYPPSIGTEAYRAAAAGWMQRRLGVRLDADRAVAACVGTKEFVGGAPYLLRLRTPDRDTVLYPAVSYPTYAMGAELAGCRAVPVSVRADWTIDLDSIDPADAGRALCLWVNTPGNPAGGLDDLAAAAEWGRSRGVPVLSDECYVEFTWDRPRASILQHGSSGVVAVHSLSKRSNLAGARAGFYTGDPELVGYLREVRKHLGLMVPGPVQDAAIAAWSDDEHVEVQRDRYRSRLVRLRSQLRTRSPGTRTPTRTATGTPPPRPRRATSPPAGSTSGSTLEATRGGWPASSRPRSGWYRARASSTARRGPAWFGSLPCSPIRRST